MAFAHVDGAVIRSSVAHGDIIRRNRTINQKKNSSVFFLLHNSSFYTFKFKMHSLSIKLNCTLKACISRRSVSPSAKTKDGK